MTRPVTSARDVMTNPFTRRSFIAGVGGTGLALFLAGCGDDSAGETEGGSGETRSFVDGRGETVTIPAAPKRVITTEQTLDLAVLGVAPIGTRNLEFDTRTYPEYRDLLSTTTDLGTEDLDLEEVLALTPDLIITTTGSLDVADQFERIAPTVFQDIDSPDKKHRWNETLLFVGDVLGKKPEAEKLLAEYEARCQDFQSKMGGRIQTTQVSVMRVADDGLEIYTLGSFSGGVLRDAGLRRPANQDLDAVATAELTNDEGESFDLSPERLREADGDVIFVVTSLPADQSEWDEEDQLVRKNADALTKNPLWSQLKAAKNGQTFEVSKHWNGESLVDAQRVLDDLEKHLLGA